jgi:hypothetical protein
VLTNRQLAIIEKGCCDETQRLVDDIREYRSVIRDAYDLLDQSGAFGVNCVKANLKQILAQGLS